MSWSTPVRCSSPDPRRSPTTDAIAWFDSERSTFVPAIRAAAQNGLHELRLADRRRPGVRTSTCARASTTGTSRTSPACTSAIACGDRRGEAILHRNLGQLALYQDDWDAAWHHLTEAAAIFDEVGDRHGDGIAAVGLGTWLRERGRPDEALAQYEKAVAGVRRGRRHERRSGGPERGRVDLVGRDDPITAGRYLAEAFLLGVRLGDAHREAKVRRRIAALRIHQGRHRPGGPSVAGAPWRSSPAWATTTARRTARAELGRALIALGERPAARGCCWTRSRSVSRLGDRSVEGQAAYDLGQLYCEHRERGLRPPLPESRGAGVAARRQRRQGRRRRPLGAGGADLPISPSAECPSRQGISSHVCS